jgi:polar amino acid transport system permease protein
MAPGPLQLHRGDHQPGAGTLSASARTLGGPATAEPGEIDIARLRHVRPLHYGRLLAAALIAAFAAFIVVSFANGKIDWATAGHYLFWPTVMAGLANTIWISVASMAAGVALGVLCAVARGSPNPVLRGVAILYAWFFRGTPVILQLLVWFNLALVFPRIGIHGLWEVKTVNVITPVIAAIVGLGLNEGAYVSEIVRGGLLAVDRGQYEAALSIGLSYYRSLRRIIMPQAMRVIIPPLGNNFIGLVKTSSLASIIGFTDLLHNAQDIYYTNVRVIELLSVAGFWYLMVVSVLSALQVLLERHFGKGQAQWTR